MSRWTCYVCRGKFEWLEWTPTEGKKDAILRTLAARVKQLEAEKKILLSAIEELDEALDKELRKVRA